MDEERYYVGIRTNLYAGNFEREMCAFITGHIGDCMVGKEFANEKIEEEFEGFIGYEDDEGCSRPVKLGLIASNVEIIFEEKPTNLIDLIKLRAYGFKQESGIKNLEILGFYLRTEVTYSTMEEL